MHHPGRHRIAKRKARARAKRVVWESVDNPSGLSHIPTPGSGNPDRPVTARTGTKIVTTADGGVVLAAGSSDCPARARRRAELASSIDREVAFRQSLQSG